MDKFYGKAVLDDQKNKTPVLLCLNLAENVFEVRYQIDSSSPMSAFTTDIFDADIRLLDIEIPVANGILRKNYLDGLFATYYSGGGFSNSDSSLGRALNLLKKESGITTIYIQSRQSRVAFDFHNHSQNVSQYEIVYTNNRDNIHHCNIIYNSNQIAVNGDKNGLVVKSSTSIKTDEEWFRIYWSIMQGGWLELRAILDSTVLILNMASDKSLSRLGPLWSDHNDITPMFNAISAYFKGLVPGDRARWRRATYYYLDGLGRNIPLEMKMINFFIFLEMIDKSKTLGKNDIAHTIGINLDDADILCRARNFMVHHGDSTGSAIEKAVNEINVHHTITSSKFRIFPSDATKTGFHAYLIFAQMLGKCWIDRCGWSNQWNDYQDIIKNI